MPRAVASPKTAMSVPPSGPWPPMPPSTPRWSCDISAVRKGYLPRLRRLSSTCRISPRCRAEKGGSGWRSTSFIFGNAMSSGGDLAVLLRTAATNDRAAERVLQVFRQQVVPVVAAVSPDAASTRAALITSQFLGMAFCRYVVRMPELTKVDAHIILTSLGRTIQRYLDDPLGRAGVGPAGDVTPAAFPLAASGRRRSSRQRVPQSPRP